MTILQILYLFVLQVTDAIVRNVIICLMTSAMDFNTAQLCCLIRTLSKEVMTQRRYIDRSVIF
jgi:hypothetical protein